jgi:glycine/D-amino acid oxidase-like deaminating enzyme
MRSSYDAIIIGAGVIGTAIGLELARRGLKTVNVERHPAARLFAASIRPLQHQPLRSRAIIIGRTGRNISASKTNEGSPAFARPAAWF